MKKLLFVLLCATILPVYADGEDNDIKERCQQWYRTEYTSLSPEQKSMIKDYYKRLRELGQYSSDLLEEGNYEELAKITPEELRQLKGQLEEAHITYKPTILSKESEQEEIEKINEIASRLGNGTEVTKSKFSELCKKDAECNEFVKKIRMRSTLLQDTVLQLIEEQATTEQQ